MGLGPSVHIPESHGGAGLGLVTAVLLEEALAEGDASVAFALGGGGSFATAVAELGAPEESSRWLPMVMGPGGMGAVAFSERRAHPDRPGFATRAVRDGDAFVLDGEKAFVLHADWASHLLVIAQVDEAAGWSGLGAFVVDVKSNGVSISAPATTLGLDAVRASSVVLSGVRVPASQRVGGEGPEFGRALLRFFVKEALKVSARAVGLCQFALTTSLDYVTNRKAFGKPIGHFQAIAFALADRSMEVDAARTMVWRAAARWDAFGAKPSDRAEREALLASAFAISYALESAMRAGDGAVQLHGGAGFMRDYPVEKLMRDAKQMQVCFMTAEQADQLAAALELGVALDPGLVLPTPETQAVFT
jgi:alkylation response protein AidB-like acyl-CoA dehydrogenase